MEKQKRWHFYLILAVIILTLYNILPTIFYYTKPLKDPITEPRAEKIAMAMIDRVNELEEESKAWLYSFSNLLGVKPTSIDLKDNDPRLLEVSFKNSREAKFFARFLPRAGNFIPFVPSQLELLPSENEDQSKVIVVRQIGVRLKPSDVNTLFQFSSKFNDKGQISDLYQQIVEDRVTQLARAFGGASKNASQLSAFAQNPTDQRFDDAVIVLAKEIVDVEKTFGKTSPIAKRYYSSLSQIDQGDANGLVQKFIVRSDALKSKLETQKNLIEAEQKKLKDQGISTDSNKDQQISLLENQRNALETANAILKKNAADPKTILKPLTNEEIHKSFSKGLPMEKGDRIQILSLDGRNPFIQSLAIDWNNDKISINFFDDVQKIRLSDPKTEAATLIKEQLSQFVINDIARGARLSDESLIPDNDTFAVKLNQLSHTNSFLTLNLGNLAQKQAEQIQDQLNHNWTPKYPDLLKENYPIRDWKSFKSQKNEDQKLGLVIYAPSMSKEAAPEGFHNGSIYVIAKGMNTIIQKYRQNPESTENEVLIQDVNQLNSLLQKYGFIGYPGSLYGLPSDYSKDYIFELEDFYSMLLKATREDFTVKGSKKLAVLDFSDVEQRIIAMNKIDDRIQEDLVKWKEEYGAAKVDINATTKYQIPAPTRNVYWENFKLSFSKYFRGDDRKILKWGLDLSGGKTVRIGLTDHNNRPVTNPEDLHQAVNELYTRINKMGVSERTIRIENNNILLDFPGSQGLSASDLIKASAMYFHIVNEKFTPKNPTLKEPITQFLQNVWNEAVVTNRKDVDSINEIAWQQLGGDTNNGQDIRPRSEYARILYENGLRLANPKDKYINHDFNDTISSIGVMRGDDFAEWDGQANPLIVIFHNYALEGSSLDNIHVGFDSTEGNNIAFGIKRSYDGSQETGSPRDDFYAWTSQFSEDKISGTPKEAYSEGNGWRMAVILNGTIITKPALRAALRDGATISGRFSQREVNQLAADLKAGSLSFTPRILSEQNVSAELGQEERTKGFIASAVALALVVIAMVGYYRFAGVVASCAVLFNILIMWGVLQNLDAAITLPGIAGIVLTIGMAVDANVLVFERIREEFKISGRIGSAIQAGYRKAFSAIVDSNITTIIAAIILIQFDSGPVKGFAVTLIIGILSSMFTALFMTRYFFAGWAQNPEHKSLPMNQFIGKTNIDFLGMTKKAVIASLILMVLGTYMFIEERKTIFGMDFTGGYSLNVNLEEKPDVNYRLQATDALLAHGASSNDFQIRELTNPNQLRIQLGMGIEEKGHPFYQLPESLTEGKFSYPYQSNPRIVWLVNALADKNLNVQPSQLENLDKNWTAMSGQFSDTMRFNALIGLAIALLSILIYLTFRFEFNFAIGAVVGLAHDVIITIGVLALFHSLGFPVQIDLQVVGAIMTIIGYSLNDTIIVFDRIREDMKLMRKMPFNQIINHALNVTLSRTIMTSGTTLLVLLALVLLGSQSIFSFSLVMTIGVIVGTFSSLFIASPVMLYFHNREIRNQEDEMKLKKA
jgi:SecD/SecF fusion protein